MKTEKDIEEILDNVKIPSDEEVEGVRNMPKPADW